MSAFDPRRVPPAKIVQLLNSDATIGPVLTSERLRRHREQAGLLISADMETVDFLKYCAWLVARRHAKAERSLPAGSDKKPKLGPRFKAIPPKFGE